LLLGGAAEASSRGAALLALEAVGKIASIEEDQFVVDQVFEPDMARHARYQQGLARQEELYERVFSESTFAPRRKADEKDAKWI
jgi:gluconokinase